VVGSWADDLVRIDFRNRIPGVVDAPVYDFDGVTPLGSSNPLFWAMLLTGTNSYSLVGSGISDFTRITNAGYWYYESPLEVVVPHRPSLGEEVWFQVQILEMLPSFPFPEFAVAGQSEAFSMVVTNHVMPMVGLESFKLVPERLEISRQTDRVIIQWLWLGAARYELEEATSLEPAASWAPTYAWSVEQTGWPGIGDAFSVTNAVSDRPQFFRLKRWRSTW
jgi:hypothetical protein